MFQIGWSGRIDPDQNIYSDWYPGNGLNYTGADYPALDQLLTQARQTTSTSARHGLYTQIVQLLHNERNIVYLWYDKYELGLRRNVSGVAFYPDGLIRLKTAQAGG
jgi:peptide/nickel transport system substrate-binding protein